MKPVLLSLFLFLFSCTDKVRTEGKVMTENDTVRVPPQEFSADTTDGRAYIAVLKNDDYKNLSVSKDELRQINSLLIKSIEGFNAKNTDNTIDLRYYKRQYVPQLNEKGEKEIAVYGLCATSGELWKQGIIITHDGGKCYFYVIINLDNNTHTALKIHGSA